MKKISLNLLVSLIFISSVASASSSNYADSTTTENPTSALEKHINETRGFSIEYPKEWLLQDSTFFTMLALPLEFSLSHSFIPILITSFNIVEGVTFDQYFNDSIKDIESYFNKPQIHGAGDIIINNTPAKWIHYSDEILKIEYHFLAYYLHTEDTISFISFTANANDFNRFRPDVENIVMSFKLINKDIDSSLQLRSY